MSPRTVHFLNSLTNRVKVTIYYDRDDTFYTTVLALLNEYSYVNPRISVRTVERVAPHLTVVTNTSA